VLLVPKKEQPPIITVGKTAEENWNTGVRFDIDAVYLDE
jgi:hypothetical protein